MSRTLILTERRPRAVRLPRAELAFLLGAARHVMDVAPTFRSGVYVLTPRGLVGFLSGPTVRYEVRPKLPWPNLRLLLGLGSEPGGEPHAPAGGLLVALATAFADRLDALARTGFVAGFGEVEAVSPFLRGRLRHADQMRDAAARAFPGFFHIDEPVFDLNTPWNRAVKATASALLRRPELAPALRARIARAAGPLAAVADAAFSEDDEAAARREPRAAGYAPLLDVCGIIRRGLASFDPHATQAGAFLLDLGQAFERYLADALADALAPRPGWAVEAHPPFALGPAVLQPDLLIRKRGTPRAVLDAKWKTGPTDAADLHQVLAYAALTGASRVGLVYPGRTDGRAVATTSDGRIRVTRYRLRVVGAEADLAASAARLARDVRRR